MKIIHSYQTSYKTVKQPPGFADFIIGTMSLFCMTNNLCVDYSNHPISHFLTQNNSNECVPSSSQIFEIFNTDYEFVLNTIKTLNPGSYVATNVRGYKITEDLKHFIKNTFAPQKQFSELIETQILNLKLKNFETIHIRMGDFNMFKQISNWEYFYNKINKVIYPNKQYFLTSDNKFIKECLSVKYDNIIINNNTPIHLGDLRNAELKDVEQTLLDYFIMSKSKQINAYSIYGGSGFSLACSEIHCIPYTIQSL